MDISAWLRELGLERYEQAFRENEVGLDVLPKLTAEDLKEIGVIPVGDRRRLLEAIAVLCGENSAGSRDEERVLTGVHASPSRTAMMQFLLPPVPAAAISPILPPSGRLGKLGQTTGGFRWIVQD